MTIKYYVYVSDSKVEMIYAQIPTQLRKRLAAQLSIDLKVVSATLTTSSAAETRYSKLDLVRRYLEDNESIGTVDEPGPYVPDDLVMRWGAIREGRLVYFGGRTSAVVVGLAGSRNHVIGYPGRAVTPESAPYSSGAADLIEALSSADPSIGSGTTEPSRDVSGSLGEMAAYSILSASEGMRGPVQRPAFLTKRVGEGEVRGQRVLLGSPLYVSQVD